MQPYLHLMGVRGEVPAARPGRVVERQVAVVAVVARQRHRPPCAASRDAALVLHLRLGAPPPATAAPVALAEPRPLPAYKRPRVDEVPPPPVAPQPAHAYTPVPASSLLSSSAALSAAPPAPAHPAPPPLLPVAPPAPIPVRLAERLMDDMAALHRYVGATDPALLSASALPAALHLVSRLVASLQRPRDFSPPQSPSHLSPASPGAAGAGGAEQLPANVTLADFTLLDTIGTGTFGKVKLCRHRHSGRMYCLKVLSKEKIVRLKQQEHVKNEKWVLNVTQHPFVVRLHATFQDSAYLYFLMEFVPGGELFTCIRRATRLSNTVARFYAAEIVLALTYLHGLGIIHRDLKPENLLIDAHGHVKLTDFGFAKHVVDRTYTMCGTPEYIAPEVILSKGHAFGADWWSLGVLIYEMLVGQPPFYGDANHTVFEKILSSRPSYPSYLAPAARHIVEALLVIDVPARLGCGAGGGEDIKRHDWFAGLDWGTVLARATPGPIRPRAPPPAPDATLDQLAALEGSAADAMLR